MTSSTVIRLCYSCGLKPDTRNRCTLDQVTPAVLLPQVTGLSLGKGRQQRDRIFVAAGNTVSRIHGDAGGNLSFHTSTWHKP